MYWAPKPSKYVTLLPFTYKAIQWVLTDFLGSTICYQDLLLMSHAFILDKWLNLLLGERFLE